MTMELPRALDDLIDYRFPDALDLDFVRHSDRCYTIVLMDLDYKHYTFRMTLSLDQRWSLVPISGFEDNASPQL